MRCAGIPRMPYERSPALTSLASVASPNILAM